MQSFVSHLLLFASFLLVACTPQQPEDLLPATTLTVRVAAESTLSEDAYPLTLTVRTNSDAEIRGRAVLPSLEEEAVFSLPTWMQYQLILLSAKGAFVSTECTLRDQPKTVCLFLSGTGIGENDHGDTIHVNLDDTISIPSVMLPPLPAFVEDHLVIYADTIDERTLSLTCLSLEEWEKLPSANHAVDSLLARSIAAEYQEMNLSDWHIPSVEEAKRLRSLYLGDSESFALLCSLLEAASLPSLVLYQGSENARYLCDEGRKTFSLVPSTTISKAGTKATNYRLRLLSSFTIHPQE